MICHRRVGPGSALTISLAFTLTSSIALAQGAAPTTQQSAATENETVDGVGQDSFGEDGADGGNEAIRLAPIAVQAESDQGLVQDGYVPISGKIGTKIETPFTEIPQSVSVITERQLDDRNPLSLEETLEYTPGVTTGAYGYDPRYDAFFVRGFSATYNGIFRDGLRRYAGPNSLMRVEPYGLEAVEVLKGPSSTIYGASSPGGLVNLVTKKPTEQDFREAELLFGSYGLVQGNFDLSGAINEDETLFYRLTGVARNANTNLEGGKNDRYYIAPAVTWKPQDQTTLTVFGEYMYSVVPGTAAYFNKNGQVTDYYGGSEDYNDYWQSQYRIEYALEHEVNSALTVNSASRFAGINNDLEYTGYYGSDPTTNPNAFKGAGRAAETMQYFTTDNSLVYDLDTGPLSHTVLAGADYGWTSYTSRQGQGYPPGVGPTPVLAFTESQDQQNTGVYIFDRIEYGDLMLNLGGRRDWLWSETTTPTGTGGRATTSQDAAENSWQAAISYRLIYGIVPYFNYQTSFTPNVGTLVDGSPAAPTTANQKEIGIKLPVPHANALITASLFDIEMTDGVVFDASSGVNQQVQQDMRSRGFEIEGQATLLSGLSLTASYAYTDVEIEKGAVGTVGNTLNGIPYNSASVYADYTQQSGALAGFGGGLGVRYVGMSYGNDQNTIENDPRTFVDAALHYELGFLTPTLDGTRVQLNASNLFDKVEQVCNAGYCYKDEGFRLTGGVRYRF